ncbi:MAG: hypothetical protein GY796_03395 [Chloroflexi bacterium]|nr:hypothetical protein [Chloroflexota bacterium]
MKRFFWNEVHNRPRAFWRIIIQMLVWNLSILFLYAPIALANRESLSFGAFLIHSPDWVRMVTLIVTVILMARFVDRRRFTEYGLNIREKAWWQDLGIGLLLGALTMSLIFLALLALNWIEIVDTFYIPGRQIILITVSVSFLTSVAGAVYQTLWIWSYTLRNAAEGFIYLNRLNGRAAVIGALVMCLIYFVFIAADGVPELTTVFASNIFRIGILLALPFILTQRLGMSIGLIIGWSVFQLNIYGLQAVGSLTENPSLLVVVEKGPEVWTGGNAGVGTGLMAMIALLLLSGIITAWSKRRTGKRLFDGSMAYYTPQVDSVSRVP